MNYSYAIEINESERLIKFEQQYHEKKCDHSNVTVSLEKNDLYCNDCNTSLNPIFWIEQNFMHLQSVTQRNSMILAEAMVIQERLKKTGLYVCKHCLEENEIDFKRLLSKKSVSSGLRIIDQEISGFKIET